MSLLYHNGTTTHPRATPLGAPTVIMQAGGWKSDAAHKAVYRHAMPDKKDEMRDFAAQYITELIENQ